MTLAEGKYSKLERIFCFDYQHPDFFLSFECCSGIAVQGKMVTHAAFY